MLVQQMLMLRDVTIVKIGNTGIQKDIEKKCEIKDREIESIVFSTDYILHCPVNPENPKGFDQQVQDEKQCKIRKELFPHSTISG